MIDFHCHTFPDKIAANTVNHLAQQAKVANQLDGTVKDLLDSMAINNINHSVICSIATKPKQFQAILDWSIAIKSEQIIPLPSIHPNSNNIKTEVAEIKKHGFFEHTFFKSCC